jgi:hypothetical protein
MVQNGRVDTWSSYSLLNIDFFQQFLLTNTFGTERFGAVMQREKKNFAINFNGLLAGIHSDAFVTLFIALICVSIISWLNEKRHRHIERRNTYWHILNSLMPSNMEPLKCQTGWTRKVLILTSGFAVLLSTTYYQSNLLQEILITKQEAQKTITDIVNEVKTSRANVYLDATTLQLINEANLKDLQHALNTNPPIFDMDKIGVIHKVKTGEAIIIEELEDIHFRLSELPPAECANFAIVELNEITSYGMTLMLNKQRVDLLEPLNVIVAERINYVTNLINKYQMSDECRENIYHTTIAEPTFVPLSMYTLSGAFALTIGLLLFACFVFTSEIFIARYVHRQRDVVESNIAQNLDFVLTRRILYRVRVDKRDEVIDQYLKFRDLLFLHEKFE